jgi:hypothetical protein
VIVMGERVHVRTVPAEPVDSADEGARTVDYAKPDLNPSFPTFWKAVASVRAAGSELYTTWEPYLERGWRRLGGTRQVLFAVGVAFVLGGFGATLSPRDEGPVLAMVIGGLLIGLTVRITGRRNE